MKGLAHPGMVTKTTHTYFWGLRLLSSVNSVFFSFCTHCQSEWHVLAKQTHSKVVHWHFLCNQCSNMLLLTLSPTLPLCALYQQ